MTTLRKLHDFARLHRELAGDHGSIQLTAPPAELLEALVPIAAHWPAAWDPGRPSDVQAVTDRSGYYTIAFADLATTVTVHRFPRPVDFRGSYAWHERDQARRRAGETVAKLAADPGARQAIPTVTDLDETTFAPARGHVSVMPGGHDIADIQSGRHAVIALAGRDPADLADEWAGAKVKP